MTKKQKIWSKIFLWVLIIFLLPVLYIEFKTLRNYDIEEKIVVKDANGTLLNEGDKVTVAKDLKIKGSSQVIKVGTKAIVRRIVDGKDHQLDCKVDGIGEMMVTAKFVKRA